MQKPVDLQKQADKFSKQAELSLKLFLYYLIIGCFSWLGFVCYSIYKYGSGIKW